MRDTQMKRNQTNQVLGNEAEGDTTMKSNKNISGDTIIALRQIQANNKIDGRTLNGLVKKGLAVKLEKGPTLTNTGEQILAAQTKETEARIGEGHATAPKKNLGTRSTHFLNLNKAMRAAATKSAVKVMPLCACGCGAHTKGGRFCMGHDAKLMSAIKKGSNATPRQVHMHFFDKVVTGQLAVHDANRKCIEMYPIETK